jgi:hypothetical protein
MASSQANRDYRRWGNGRNPPDPELDIRVREILTRFLHMIYAIAG